MPKKKKMVAWFEPVQLIQTAMRVMISTIFGAFADRREAFAAANPISDGAIDPSFDYSQRHQDGELWIDYVADTGDGWNPTFAIARLLAEDSLKPAGAKGDLQRGRVLIMGGDEVYPTPSPEEYDDRLVHPYDEAWKPGSGAGRWSPDEAPDLYALPGNHDWYDGLSSFFHLFCRRTVKAEGQAGVDRKGRIIGGRQTHQTRSYFALKLPHGWWLWGTDSQLEGYIDQPQIDYFRFVAEHWMGKGSKLILCTGTPDWEYVEAGRPKEAFWNFSYLSRLAFEAGRGHQLKLVLSGDSHHYARYREGDLDFITCGGGGAFLHPTHKLTDKTFDFPFPRPGQKYSEGDAPYPRSFALATKKDSDEKALYPSPSVSRRLAAGNIFFAFRNWQLTLTLAGLYLFFTWILDAEARLLWQKSLSGLLKGGTFCDSVAAYWLLILRSPAAAMLCAAALAGYYYFADEARWWKRLLLGGVHAALHAVAVTLVTCLVLRRLPLPVDGALNVAASLIAAAAASALASATLIGLYLWFCLDAFGKHWGHFSSLAIQGHKSFLRLRIDREGALHVHPVGLARVPNDRRRRSGYPERLEPEMIEPAFEIR